MGRITLDSRTFQALASSTRLSVLRALDERRKTLSELARDLELNKATVHEHLQLLTAAELVRKRDDEGRKWIYYELSWTGKKLLHPQETTTFNVLLGLTVAAAGGGMAVLGRALASWLESRSLEDAADRVDQPPAAGTAMMADTGQESQKAPPAPPDFMDDGGWLGTGLLAASALFTTFAVLLRRQLRTKPGKEPAEGDDASP